MSRHRQGDAINAVLAAVGYNFRRLIVAHSFAVPNQVDIAEANRINHRFGIQAASMDGVGG